MVVVDDPSQCWRGPIWGQILRGCCPNSGYERLEGAFFAPPNFHRVIERAVTNRFVERNGSRCSQQVRDLARIRAEPTALRGFEPAEIRILAFSMEQMM